MSLLESRALRSLLFLSQSSLSSSFLLSLSLHHPSRWRVARLRREVLLAEVDRELLLERGVLLGERDEQHAVDVGRGPALDVHVERQQELALHFAVRSLGVVKVVGGGVVNDLTLGLDDEGAPLHVQLEILHAREVHVYMKIIGPFDEIRAKEWVVGADKVSSDLASGAGLVGVDQSASLLLPGCHTPARSSAGERVRDAPSCRGIAHSHRHGIVPRHGVDVSGPGVAEGGRSHCHLELINWWVKGASPDKSRLQPLP